MWRLFMNFGYALYQVLTNMENNHNFMAKLFSNDFDNDYFLQGEDFWCANPHIKNGKGMLVSFEDSSADSYPEDNKKVFIDKNGLCYLGTFSKFDKEKQIFKMQYKYDENLTNKFITRLCKIMNDKKNTEIYTVENVKKLVIEEAEMQLQINYAKEKIRKAQKISISQAKDGSYNVSVPNQKLTINKDEINCDEYFEKLNGQKHFLL